MTKVMGLNLRLGSMAAWVLPLLLALSSWGQDAPRTSSELAALRDNPAEKLYLQLQSVGLDKSRVFQVREASVDRAALHISFSDGTIAFTEDVAGHVTGAFFEGDGEVLLLPPDEVERASMSLFTGAAILEERFTTGYFRFSDDTYNELKPILRPAENPQEFVTQWNEAARNLATVDAFRLLLTFSQFLPDAGPPPSIPNKSLNSADDRLLHARLQGRNLGTFDVYYDSMAPEQIRAGALTNNKGEDFYDVWTSFSPRTRSQASEEAGNGMDEEIESDSLYVSSYKIRAEVNPPTQLKGDALLQVEMRRGGQRAVVFELSRFLQIEQVEADGHPLAFVQNPALEGTQLARRGNDLVALVFPQPLRIGQRLQLRFVYRGDVLSEAGSGLLYVGARGTWYPNRGHAACNYDLAFKYPDGWTLVATGKHMPNGAQVKVPAGTQASHWVSERAIPLAGFNLGKYTRAVAQAGSVTVETYAAFGVERTFPQPPVERLVPPPLMNPRGIPSVPVVIEHRAPSPAHHAQPVADESARAIEFFAHRFGPFPYSSLALAQIPGVASQGWPGLIYLSGFAFLTTEEKTQLQMNPLQRTRTRQLVAHETAHQWWGDLVTWKTYRDQWLVEALAEYSSLMLLESEDPAAFRDLMDAFREDLLQKNKDGVPLMDAGPVTLGLRLANSHFPRGYEGISYERGAWLFHSLRAMMRDAQHPGPRQAARESSDEPFLRALRRLRERYEGKPMTTRDMLRVFEEELPPSLWYEGHKSLNWFYQGWINGTAVPRLELHAVRYTDGANSTVISGTILQKDAPKELVTSIPLYGTSAGKSVLLGRVFADGSESGFRVTAPAGTRKVVVDPNGTVLKRSR